MNPIKLTRTVSTDGSRMDKVRAVLKKKNAAFKKMTKAQQRVRIAKDVIEQLDARKMIAKAHSGFLKLSTYMDFDPEYDEYGKLDVGEITSQVKCQVCGIGSLFVAAVERADELKAGDLAKRTWGHEDLNNRSGQMEYLEKWFPENMLDEIEDYFEEWGPDWSPIARKTGATARLRMIMENIISNNGAFKPTKGKHAGTPEDEDEIAIEFKVV